MCPKQSRKELVLQHFTQYLENIHTKKHPAEPKTKMSSTLFIYIHTQIRAGSYQNRQNMIGITSYNPQA